NLVDLLGSDLISMEYVERRYGFPFYNMYGDTDPNNSNFVCHSSKVMFPVSLVLGDLYLMKGDEAACREAALHYYNVLNDENGGPLLTSYYSRANMREGEDQPTYIYNATPYNEKYENSRFYESITCIPSNKGKLDGNVNTDISRLFGFEPRTSTSGSGDDVSSQVALTLNFERQLVASKGYDALCDSQKYEVYIGDSNNPFLSLEVMPGIGDARRSWIMDVDGQQYVGRLGSDRVYGTFVSKQNPGYSFSTVYPVVYRRSQVWLRFAEALNRAGYPSYAFAILKNGLCQNDYWYPREEDYEPTEVVYRWINTNDTLDVDTIPEQEGNGAYLSADYLRKAVLDTYLALGIDSADIAKCGIVDSFVVNRKNYASAYDRTCYYLDHRELEKSRVEPFLNFNTYYMEPRTSGYTIVSKTSMYGFSTTMTRYPTSSISDFYVTVGIHQNGCGRVRYDERAQSGVESVYNYVDQVAKKIKENHGRTVTKEDIYGDDETVRGYVIEAVEDLIVDECGLELAFEGSRFSDLARVSLRRGDPSYLAKRVAKRRGEMDMGLYNYLSQSPKHWYLPFPTE
ncbi:MAG: RagB/SusD family nutrient uptake outer membrane protein, partial [Bacteroidaceae bacterium]